MCKFVEKDRLKEKVKNNVFIVCLDKTYILSAQFQNQTKHCWSLNDFLIVLGNLDALRRDTASIAGQLLKEASFVKTVSKMIHFLSASNAYISISNIFLSV